MSCIIHTLLLYISGIGSSGLFLIKHNSCNYEHFRDILVGLLGRGIRASQDLYLPRKRQGRKTWPHIHVSSRIRTHNPRVRAIEDHTRLRMRGHWDRHIWTCTKHNTFMLYQNHSHATKYHPWAYENPNPWRRIIPCLINHHCN